MAVGLKKKKKHPGIKRDGGVERGWGFGVKGRPIRNKESFWEIFLICCPGKNVVVGRQSLCLFESDLLKYFPTNLTLLVQTFGVI